MRIDPHLSSCTKLISKGIKDLNERPDTLNMIEEKMGIVLNSLVQAKNFLKRIPVAQALRTINQWDFIKLKSFFCMAKGTIIRREQQLTKWEKILTDYISSRGLIVKTI